MGISYTADGRPILTGASCLPPMEPRSPRPTASGRTTAKGASEPKRKTADRFAVLNAFVDVTMRDLTPSEKLVWFVLYRDVRGGVVKVSQADIATRAGMGQASVSRAIKRLEKRGLLRTVKQGGFRKGLSTYRIRGSA